MRLGILACDERRDDGPRQQAQTRAILSHRPPCASPATIACAIELCDGAAEHQRTGSTRHKCEQSVQQTEGRARSRRSRSRGRGTSPSPRDGDRSASRARRLPFVRLRHSWTPVSSFDELQQRDDYEGQLVVAPEDAAAPGDATRELARPLPVRARTVLDASRDRAAVHAPGRDDRPAARRDATRSSRRGPRRARRSRITSRCSKRSSTASVALYLSPTKALAQDQLRQVARFELDEVRADTYDGDTPTAIASRSVRRKSNLVLTNPDMLHIGILPHHQLWRDVPAAKLAFVVVDEAHVLRGIFGSHAALDPPTAASRRCVGTAATRRSRSRPRRSATPRSTRRLSSGSTSTP